jgi:hypothetical protein
VHNILQELISEETLQMLENESPSMFLSRLLSLSLGLEIFCRDDFMDDFSGL